MPSMLCPLTKPNLLFPMLLCALGLILVPLPCGSQALDSHPPRRFEHIKGKGPIVRQEGQTQAFLCEANGRPNPTYAWQRLLKNGSPYWVRDNQTTTYRIERVSRRHAGQYRCSAYNSQGGLRDSSITLLVGYLDASKLDKLDWRSRSPLIELASGETFRLRVPAEVEAYPPPHARWKENGFNVKISDRYYVTMEQELIILNVLPDPDKGERLYQAILSNNFQNQRNIKTPLYRLKVTSSRRPPPAQRSPSLVYHSGNVTHTIGDPTRSAATFECVFTAKPLDRLRLRWYRAELTTAAQTELVNDELKYKIEPIYSRRLTVLNVGLADAAKYVCEAQVVGSGGILNSNVERQVAWLHVLTPPRLTRTEPDDLWLRHGENSSLSCQAEGHPPPRIAWYRNAQLIVNSSRYSVQPNGYLHLFNVQPEDSAIFQCFAENSAGEDYHTSWLRVESSSPKFTKRPSDATGVVDNSMTFDCAAVGAPKPRILWLKDENPILHNERIHRLDGSLSITRLVTKDAGEYKCIATSESGRIEAAFSLNVYNRTRIWPRPERRIESPKGSNARLQCSSIADSRLLSQLRIRWHYRAAQSGAVYRPVVNRVAGGANLQSDQLIIDNLSPSDAGYYKCTADAGEAGGGPDEATIQLVVTELPISPGPPNTGLVIANPDAKSASIEANDCRSVGGIQVTWSPAPFDGHSPITGYAVQFQVNGQPLDSWKAARRIDRGSADGRFQERSVCLSTSLLSSAGVAYRFRVLAINKLGFSTESNPSDWIKLPPRPPSGPPRSFFVTGGQSNSSLLASWQPPEPRHRQGRLVGYRLRYSIAGLSVSQRELNVTNPDATSQILPNLQPDTEYNVWIACVNVQGRGPWTATPATARTAEGRPTSAPPGLSVALVSARSARIEFDALPRAQLPGRLVGYTIAAECDMTGTAEAESASADDEAPEPCVRIEQSISPNRIADSNSRVRLIFDGLRPHTRYLVSVRAQTGAGFGPASSPPVAMTTSPDAPEAPRGQLKLSRVRDTSARISWRTPLRPNGIVTGYRISWQPVVANDAMLLSNKRTVDVAISPRRYDLTGLSPSTRYRVAVSAVNSAGVGSPSTVELVTKQRASTPDSPRQLRVVGIQPRSLRLQFLPPISDGGAPVTAWLPEVQRALVEGGFGGDGDPVASDWMAMKEIPVPEGDSDSWRSDESQQLLLEGLQPFTRYRLRLSAKNSRGVSPPSSPTTDWFATEPTPPERPPANLTLRVRSASQLAARWLPLEAATWCGPAYGYQVQFSIVDGGEPLWQNASNGRINDPSGSYHLLESLLPSQRYRVRVLALGLAGSIASSPVEAVTWDSAPLTVPNIADVSVLESSWPKLSISIKLRQLNDTSGVTSYTAAVFEVSSTTDVVDLPKLPPSSAIFAQIDTVSLTGVISQGGDGGLKPATRYLVMAAANNRRGRGPWTPVADSISVKTPPSAKPYEAPQLVYFDWTSAKVKVCWLPPKYPGIELTGYRIRWGDKIDDQPANQLCYSPPTQGTVPCRNHVLVAGLSSDGSAEGPSARALCPASLSRPPKQPSIPTSPAVVRVTSNSADITWIQASPQPRNYTILVTELPKNVSWSISIDTLSARIVSGDESSNVTRQVTVYDLKPYRQYQFRLLARGDTPNQSDNWSKATPPRRTKPSTPRIPPKNLVLTSYGRSGVRVAWKPLLSEADWACNPSDAKSLAAYRLTFEPWFPELSSTSFQQRKRQLQEQEPRQEKLSWKATEATVSGLTQHVYYEVSLAAENAHGTGPVSQLQLVYVGEAAPEAPPTSLLCHSGISDVVCSWEAPALDRQNGPLLGYRLYYDLLQSEQQPAAAAHPASGSITLPSSKREARLDWLLPFSRYQFVVCAVNPAGEGPNSTAPVQVETPQARPGPVHKFRAVYVTPNEANLMWSQPARPNGVVVKYRLSYRKISSIQSGSSQPHSVSRRSAIAAVTAPYIVTMAEPAGSYTVDSLKENSVYQFALAAATSAGWGADSIVNVTTGPTRGSPNSPKLIACKASYSGVKLNWTLASSELKNADAILVQSIARSDLDEKPSVWKVVHRFIMASTTDSSTKSSISPILIDWDRLLPRGREHRFRLIASKQQPPSVKISSPSNICDYVSAPLSVGGSSFGGTGASALYEKWWFLTLIGISALVLINLVICSVYIGRRRRSAKLQQQQQNILQQQLLQSDTNRYHTNGSSSRSTTAARLAACPNSSSMGGVSGVASKNGHRSHQHSDCSELILACDIPNEPAEGSATFLLPSLHQQQQQKQQHSFYGGQRNRPLSSVGRVSVKQLKSAPRPSPAAAIRPVEMSPLSSSSPPKSAPLQEKKVAINLEKNSEWRTLDYRRDKQHQQQQQHHLAASIATTNSASLVSAAGYASLRKAKPPEPFNPNNVPTIGVPVGSVIGVRQHSCRV